MTPNIYSKPTETPLPSSHRSPSPSSDPSAEPTPFAFTPTQLTTLFNPKSLEPFLELGGLQSLEHGLRTNLTTGLTSTESFLTGTITLPQARHHASSKTRSTSTGTSTSTQPFLSAPQPTTPQHPIHPSDQFHSRIKVYGRNLLPPPPRKSFIRLLWDAYNDKIILLLTVAAVVSLSLGIYEAVSGQSRVDWIEGVAVCVAIGIVVTATAGNDWQKERQFRRLSRLKVDRQVRVIRSGKQIMVHIHDLTVGDLVHLEPGDCAPADGVIATNYGLRCDESLATGEADQIEKVSGAEASERVAAKGDEGVLQEKGVQGLEEENLDPFIISGSKILEGLGTYLVLSVGPHSTHGRIMMSLGTESDPTPLQVKLSRLASWIGWFGLGAALLLFFVLLFRFLAQLSDNPAPSTVKGQIFMDILIVTVTVIVVAIPEGLPLAVTLALAFATGRMLKEHNLVRQLRACETMGNATVICSDKTGTLTQNKMTAVVGFFGVSESFGHLPTHTSPAACPVQVPQAVSRFPPSFRDLLVKSIVANSTAFEERRENGTELVGNKTEIALLQLAQEHLDVPDLAAERAGVDVLQVYPFDSARKAMALVYRVRPDTYRVLVKGAAEVVLRACRTVVLADGGGEGQVPVGQLAGSDVDAIEQRINTYASAALRTIGLAYRDLPAGVAGGSKGGEKGLPRFEEIFTDMTWIGLFGIHDPLRPEVTEAIRQCHSAGVKVKMVTGDNINTALSIAAACGIKTDDGIAIEAPELRKLSDDELDAILPRLQVLARSSPSDKQLLVQHLKKLGEIVAVTGDGTNDGPALKSADVGFSMGLSGTEVAREASSIILLDDNFRSIVTAIAWGRCVNDAVAKFLQFQITVNITAVCLTVVTAIYNSSNESVFKAVQLLWLNLIMDTFAALALATDPPTPEILSRPPTPRHAPLFTPTMWKLMLGQSLYKLALCFTLYFAGDRIFGLDPQGTAHDRVLLDTIIFNTFVWMQIFNELNCRRLDNQFNIFQGLTKNAWFLVINVLMVGGQILIIFVGGEAFGVTRLSGAQWGYCLGFAVVCIPWAAVLKFVPDRWVAWALGWVGCGVRKVRRPLGVAGVWVRRLVGGCKGRWRGRGKRVGRGDEEMGVER